MDKCVFCDRAEMILENQLAWAKYDKYPVSPGHMLIISKRHVPDFFAATAEEHQSLNELLQEARLLLDENITRTVITSEQTAARPPDKQSCTCIST